MSFQNLAPVQIRITTKFINLNTGIQFDKVNIRNTKTKYVFLKINNKDIKAMSLDIKTLGCH